MFTRISRGYEYKGNEPTNSKEIVKGIYTQPNGDVYYGEWNKKDMIEGIKFTKNGDLYKGQLKDKKPHGNGYKKNHDRTEFKGIWFKGIFQEGYQRLNYGNEVFGELLDSNNIRTGISKYQVIDVNLIKNHKNKKEIENAIKIQGDDGMYEGEFKNELRNGIGSMYYKNNSIYHGEWNLDQKTGKGVFYGNNGEKYCGEWLSGIYHGHGEKIFSSGDHYVGYWVNGKMHGNGVLAKANGIVMNGEWDEDNFLGNSNDNITNKSVKINKSKKSFIKKDKNKSLISKKSRTSIESFKNYEKKILNSEIIV